MAQSKLERISSMYGDWRVRNPQHSDVKCAVCEHVVSCRLSLSVPFALAGIDGCKKVSESGEILEGSEECVLVK